MKSDGVCSPLTIRHCWTSRRSSTGRQGPAGGAPMSLGIRAIVVLCQIVPFEKELHGKIKPLDIVYVEYIEIYIPTPGSSSPRLPPDRV